MHWNFVPNYKIVDIGAMYFPQFCVKIEHPANLPFWGFYCAHMVKVTIKEPIYLKNACQAKLIRIEILILSKKL